MDDKNENVLGRLAKQISEFDTNRLVDIQKLALDMPVNQNLATEFYNRLVKLINDFDNTLDPQHEVGVRLVSFGKALTFHLDSMGCWNPSLIFFHGMTEQGEPVELIQHVTQISILLMKVPRKNPDAPKKPIGFTSSASQKPQV